MKEKNMTLETGEFGGSLSRSFRRHWRLILAEGIFLLVLGALAILLPLVAGLVVALVLGWLLFLAGLLGLITSVAMRQTPGFWWSLVSSIIAMAAGAMLFLFPIGGIVSLTLLLAIFLFADGVVTILLALSHREWASRNWGWLLLNGILDLFLAVVIFVLLPGVAAWVVGTIIGIDLIFGGISLTAMALAARQSTA
jgi:uncharacterized membrane protein HdeD (DUF308 family)